MPVAVAVVRPRSSVALALLASLSAAEYGTLSAPEYGTLDRGSSLVVHLVLTKQHQTRGQEQEQEPKQQTSQHVQQTSQHVQQTSQQLKLMLLKLMYTLEVAANFSPGSQPSGSA